MVIRNSSVVHLQIRLTETENKALEKLIMKKYNRITKKGEYARQLFVNELKRRVVETVKNKNKDSDYDSFQVLN